MDHPSFIHHKSRILIRGFYGRPATPAYSLNVLAEKLLRSAQAKGNLQNVRRLDLRRFDPDDLDDRTPRSLALDYTPSFEERFNQLEDWKTFVSPEEKKLRAARIAELTARQLEIEAKAEASRTDAEKQELLDIEESLLQLGTFGAGYLEQVPDGFGDGVSALYFPLNEPYISTHRRSKFLIDEDSPWCARLYFYKPNEGQASWVFSLMWSRYRLAFKQYAIEFYAYRPELTPAQIEAKEKRLSELLDKGRITAEDKQFKASQTETINAIKASAKAAGRGPNKLTADEKSQIAQLKKGVNDRWAEKRRREGAEEAEITRLKKELYEDVQTVQLGQKSDTLFNEPLTLTFLPQRRGFITIQLEGAEAWSYEIRSITSAHTTGTIWKRSALEIRTIGGAYKWQIGYPEPAEVGLVRIGPVDPGFDATDHLFDVGGHWDHSAGASIEWAFERVEGSKPIIIDGVPNYRQWEVIATLKPSPVPPDPTGAPGEPAVLSSRRIPFLYDASLFIAAGERTGSDVVVWDSANHTASDGKSLVKELRVVWDPETTAMSCNVILRHMATAEGSSELDSDEEPFPRDLDGRLVDIYIDDITNADAPFLARGLIRQPGPKSMGSAGADPEPLGDSTVEFLALDHWGLLDEVMTARPLGDGQDLGHHTRAVLSCRGEKASEIQAVPDNISIHLDGAGPGEQFVNQPAKGAKYSQYLKDLFETQGLLGSNIYRLRWSCDSTAFASGGFWRIETPPTAVIVIDGQEGNFSSSPDYDGRFWLRDVIDLQDDDSDLSNIFTVEGAKDHKTKEILSRTVIVYESILLATDLRHVGREKPYPVVRIPTLRTADACTRAALALSKRKCKSKRFRKVTTGFIRELRPGIIIRVDGLKVELVRCLGASLANDEMEWLVRRLE